MIKAKGQSLIFSENLSAPSVQVIVLDANMSCSSSRERVYQLMSKINGVEEFIIDVTGNQVTIKSRCQIPLVKLKSNHSNDMDSTEGIKKLNEVIC